MCLRSAWNAVTTVGQQKEGRGWDRHLGLVIRASELWYLYTNSYQASGEDAGMGAAISPAFPTYRAYGRFWTKMLATRSQQKATQVVVCKGYGQGPDIASCRGINILDIRWVLPKYAPPSLTDTHWHQPWQMGFHPCTCPKSCPG